MNKIHSLTKIGSFIQHPLTSEGSQELARLSFNLYDHFHCCDCEGIRSYSFWLFPKHKSLGIRRLSSANWIQSSKSPSASNRQHTVFDISCFQWSAILWRSFCESWGLFTVRALSFHKASGGWSQLSELCRISSLFPKNCDWCWFPWVGKILEGSRLPLVNLYVESLKLCLSRRTLARIED